MVRMLREETPNENYGSLWQNIQKEQFPFTHTELWSEGNSTDSANLKRPRMDLSSAQFSGFVKSGMRASKSLLEGGREGPHFPIRIVFLIVDWLFLVS